jgi:AGZA family xanthine/uracil permease-like MFS transporter
MGGRAAYTLATALFIGGAGVIGYFGFLYLIIPKPTVFPILVFVGLEITAQSFYATPKRHYTAVGLSLVPALAALVSITASGFGVNDASVAAKSIADHNPALVTDYVTVRMLYNGFIVISLVWASALASLIDHRLYRAAIFFAVAALFTLFGVMHSPLPSGAMYVPWDLGQDAVTGVDYNVTLAPTMFRWAIGYGLVAVLLGVWAMWAPPPPPGKLDAE